MKIAYLINQYPKVSHTFIRREILALERLGVDVLRVAIRGWDGPLVDPADVHERARTRYVLHAGAASLLAHTLRTAIGRPILFFRALLCAVAMARGSDRPLTIHLIYLAEACKVLGWLRKGAVQHVHAHFGTNAAEVASIMRQMGGPSFSFTVHGPEEFDQPKALHLRHKARLASSIVAVSSFGKSQLFRWLDDRDWHKTHVVHCGLDRFDEIDQGAPRVRQHRFVCVGRLCEQKGQLLLIEAARRLFASGKTFRLVLAGDGEMRGEIEQAIASDAHLREFVTITGWISGSDVRLELAAADALLLPSFAEGLPVVIMEAMAERRPVVSTYIAGIPELIRDGVDGLLLPAGDVDSLVLTIERLMSLPDDELFAMGDAGRERVMQRHSVDTEASKLYALFEQAVAADRP